MFQMFLEQHSYRCKENIKSRCTLNLRHFGRRLQPRQQAKLDQRGSRAVWFDGMYLCCSSSASYCGSWCDLVLTLSRLWVPLICRCLCYDRTRPSVSRKRSPPASSIWEESMKHELLDTHTQHIWKMHIYISLHTSIDFCVDTDAKKCHDASMLTDMSQVFKTSCTGCQKDFIFHLKHVFVVQCQHFVCVCPTLYNLAHDYKCSSPVVK